MRHANDHYYLVEIQYLGFRYHGWQKQLDLKTVAGMIEKTINYIWEDKHFKVLGVSRTDAMVSANHHAFQLIVREKLDENIWIADMNQNLPPDIKVKGVRLMPKDFNVLQQSKKKQYHYLFSFGEKFHPFCAPLMAHFNEVLDFGLMQEAAKCFIGEHDFHGFCEQDKPNANYIRTIDNCELVVNEIYKANFFPKKSYLLKIAGKGFLRYQVRYIMGALIAVGNGSLTIDQIKTTLKQSVDKPISFKVPASGLILNKVQFDELKA